MATNGQKVRVMFPEELEEFMASRNEGTYLLLDVRQPEEYEESHLPGAKLVPLPELVNSLAELDREKETVVYCAIGGRSLIAANFLTLRGFKAVSQLQGGIEAWEQRAATGPADFHLELIRGDESPEEAAQLAYRMEHELERFHQMAFDRSGSPEVKDLLQRLIQAEEGHKARLRELIESMGSRPGDVGGAGPMEGGLDAEEFLRRSGDFLKSPRGCLELAMIIEVQALDLYLRMADTCSHPHTREVFFGLSEEEKSHLRSLGDLLGEIAGAKQA